MNTLTVADFEMLGFKFAVRPDGQLEVNNRSVSFVLRPSYGPNGEKNGLTHWAGYKGDLFVAGWRADSIIEVINTLIAEEKYLSFNEGRESMRQDLKNLLDIK